MQQIFDVGATEDKGEMAKLVSNFSSIQDDAFFWRHLKLILDLK
jgi:hypothetical protein